MPNLTIVARIKAKPGKTELVRTELEKLIEPTRAETGCVQYDLHADNNDPSLFLFFENWGSRELWQAHMENRHLKAFLDATDGAIEELAIHEMTLIG